MLCIKKTKHCILTKTKLNIQLLSLIKIDMLEKHLYIKMALRCAKAKEV